MFELKRSRKKITARSGLGLFARFVETLRISELINCFFPKPRSNRSICASDYVLTLIQTLSGGGESISDTREIRLDQTLQELTGTNIVPSESAIGDWLKRTAKNGGIRGIEVVNDEIMRNILKKLNVSEVSISFDPSLIKAEKREAKMTYEGYKGYRPMFAFINGLQLVFGLEFREGNDNGRRFEFVKRMVEKLENWGICVKHVSIDAEFYCHEIFDYLNRKNIGYTIAVSKDYAVMENIQTIPCDSWQPFKTVDGFATDREISGMVHSMEKSNTAFFIVILRWTNKKGEACYRGIATNILNLSPSEIVWKYNARAAEENNIKELKNGFGVRKMPSGSFGGNALFVGIGVLAHNLFTAQKLLVFPKKWAKKTIKSIRWLFYEIPGRIIKKANKLVLEVFVEFDKYYELVKIKKRIEALNAQI